MFWVRVIAIAAVVIGLCIAWIMHAYPAAVIPWRPILTALVVMPAFLAAGMAACVFAPLYVEVRWDWIQFSQGQHGVRITRAQIRSAEVIAGDVPRLKVSYISNRGRSRTRECAIGRAVDLERLERFVAGFAERVDADPPMALRN